MAATIYSSLCPADGAWDGVVSALLTKIEAEKTVKDATVAVKLDLSAQDVPPALVRALCDALKARDGEEYMRLMNESGRSSEELLNNIITSATGDTKLAQGLELSKKLLDGKGAWRVHGGGFAGCVQALMPDEYFAEYRTAMENVFGAGSCHRVYLV